MFLLVKKMIFSFYRDLISRLQLSYDNTNLAYRSATSTSSRGNTITLSFGDEGGRILKKSNT